MGYEYGILQHPREIRLLKLLPAQHHEPIRCEFISIELDDESLPAYEAIAYTWGDGTIKHEVFFEGKKLGITDSVKDILLELRGSETERVLWIDTMCINQKDIDERNRQVWLMGQVYSKTKAVIIWLGPQSEDSDLAMEFIPRLLGALLTLVNQLLRTENRDLIFPSTRRADIPEWQALKTPLNRPWFERL
jgi:hypothetical protein